MQPFPKPQIRKSVIISKVSNQIRTFTEKMKLSWNEIRARAAQFAKEWQDKGYEKGETQLFYRDFFEIFGMNVVRVATFEEPVRKLGNKRGFIDLFWRGMLLAEQKSAGRDLAAARQQALEYFPGISDAELPKYLLLSDFQHFELFDIAESLETPKAAFPLAELPAHVERFAFIRGDVADFIEKQEAVTVRASEMMAELHDLLKKDGFAGLDLQILLVRLVFCLFADNTGVFEQHIFLKLVKNRSAEGGRDLGRLLAEFFDVLNTPESERQKLLDEELAQFPYINGALFAEGTRMPSFDAAMRKVLIAACEFDWQEVSPAIFGSLFQAVMDEKERREQGAHYTSEQNILRVIGPLFMDGLHAEFKKIQRQKGAKRTKTAAFRKFHARLAKLNFLDPACGCGNFLVVTYQQVRHLETMLLKELYPADQQHLDVRELSLINVDRFHGIELGAFPARIAQIALWMTDHLCNIELGNTFGQAYSRIPLVTAPNIHCADALETDWEKVVRPNKCSYILGNPPFVGAKLQSPKQRAQVRDVAQLGKSGGTLDYVCAWFLKAGEYIQKNKDIQIGFVSPNSITQGEQVGQLWPVLFGRHKLEIPHLQLDQRGARQGARPLRHHRPGAPNERPAGKTAFFLRGSQRRAERDHAQGDIALPDRCRKPQRSAPDGKGGKPPADGLFADRYGIKTDRQRLLYFHGRAKGGISAKRAPGGAFFPSFCRFGRIHQ